MAGSRLGYQPGQMKFFTFTICAALAYAQTPLAPTFTATTDNVGGAHDSIRIDLVRWSTDAELGQLMDAWNLKPVAGAARGGGRGKAAAGDDDATDPFGSFRQAQAPGGGRGGVPTANRKTPEVALAEALNAAGPLPGRHAV